MGDELEKDSTICRGWAAEKRRAPLRESGVDRV